MSLRRAMPATAPADHPPPSAPGRPKPMTAPSGGSEPRVSVGAQPFAPGRPKPMAATSEGSEPRASVGALISA